VIPEDLKKLTVEPQVPVVPQIEIARAALAELSIDEALEVINDWLADHPEKRKELARQHRRDIGRKA
jgi:hypothetical protein